MEAYFKPALPSSSGELSKVVPSKAIREANKAVERTLTEGSSGKRRQEYQKVSIEMKNKIAKYAVENGVKSAVEKFKNQVPNAPPNWKNTVKDWKDAYLRELKRKRAAGGDISDMVLQPPKRGRPLLLGVELDKKVQEYIKRLRSGHAVVNSAIVKVVSAEFYFHTISFLLFHSFFIVHRSVLTAGNLMKVKAQQSFKKFHL